MLLIELQRCLGTTYPYFHWLHDEMCCVCCNPDRNIGPGNSFWHYIVIVEDSVPITSISVLGYSLACLWWVFRWPCHLLVEYTSPEGRKIDFLSLKSKKKKLQLISNLWLQLPDTLTQSLLWCNKLIFNFISSNICYP